LTTTERYEQKALISPSALRCFRFPLLLTVFLFLGACSSTTFIYNRLGFLLPWYLERYVDLHRDQARALDEQLEPVLHWHRREELPKYIAFLDSLAVDLEEPLTLEQILVYADTFELAWYRVRDRGLDVLLTLGASLDEEQIDEFLRSLDKQQLKYERKYLDRSDEEYFEDAEDEILDSLEDYLGRLSPEQRAEAKRSARALERSDHVWLRERARWIDTLRQQLARAPGWQEEVRYSIVHWESDLDPDTMALYDRNTLRIQRLIQTVVNTRTEKQDRRLRRKLEGFREDLQLLIEQGD